MIGEGLCHKAKLVKNLNLDTVSCLYNIIADIDFNVGQVDTILAHRNELSASGDIAIRERGGCVADTVAEGGLGNGDWGLARRIGRGGATKGREKEAPRSDPRDVFQKKNSWLDYSLKMSECVPVVTQVIISVFRFLR